MADPSAEEFASWLRPRDALSKLGIAVEAASKSEIAKRILDGRIRIAGLGSSKAVGEPGQVSQPSLIALDYLHGPWIPELGEFWSLGTISFVRAPTALEGFASLSIVGSQGSLRQPEIHVFHQARLDPVAMARDFDLDLPDATAPLQEEPTRTRKGGRPAGKDGEPIARLTLRMRDKSREELRRYTAESLSLDLLEEYRKLGLDLPSADNARRNAAGILRVVRE